MGIKCGIVGLPNVGKSTLFNALTAAEVPAENYPFCTIDPNVGVVTVPDERLEAIARIVRPPRTVPAVVEFVDIAGLVRGASKGEGLGNQFLAHIRETDAVAHVVRCFESADITHVSGQPDPVSDIQTVDTELLLADLQTVQRSLDRAQRQAKAHSKDVLAWRDLLQHVLAELDAGRRVRDMELPVSAGRHLEGLQLLTAKPLLTVVNTGEDGLDDGTGRVARGGPGTGCTSLSAKLEMELTQLGPEDEEEFRASMGMTESGLDRVVRMSLRLLSLVSFFTYVSREVRAWTVPEDTPAVKAAGRIHTDMERGFIRAEVVSFDDLSECGSLAQCKKQGVLRLEGKGYPVRDGDVITFLFNT